LLSAAERSLQPSLDYQASSPRSFTDRSGRVLRAPLESIKGAITMPYDLRLTKLAHLAAVGLVASSLAACANLAPSRSASNAPFSGSSVDVVGAGGPQDDVARQIYHPGSGTDW
jgi:hypothetical protein